MIIDLHSHVLPGIDDGSPDVDTSLAMLRQQAAQGVDVVCATSHYYAEHSSISGFCMRRDEALHKLLSAGTEGLPRIVPAAEVAFFTGISERPGLERLCIQGTRTLMLEMPFTHWNGFQLEEVEALVLDRGFRVVLVHPERFCIKGANRDNLRMLEQLPVALQVNAKTLLSWSTRRLGLELLRETFCPLLASDCHNLTSRRRTLQKHARSFNKRWERIFWHRSIKMPQMSFVLRQKR